MLKHQRSSSMGNPYFFPTFGTAVIIVFSLCLYSKQYAWSPPDEGTKASIKEHPSCRAKLQSNKQYQSKEESGMDWLTQIKLIIKINH